jgi:hypothetical protein
LNWAALLGLALAYTFAETRYPALNFDDTYLMGDHFPRIADGHFWGGLHYMMFQHNLATNEFRTYGLSKLIHFGLFRIWGPVMVPYYFVMAAMSVAAAMFAAAAARVVTGSASVSVSLGACCLLGSFMLFQTFHHATYILLPLLLTTAYLALDVRGTVDRKRRILGPLLCVLIVMTGEIAGLVLLVAVGLLALRARRLGNRARVQLLLVDLFAALAVLALLYVYYRAAIFNPSLATRFSPDIPPTLDSVWTAFLGVNKSVLDLITSSGAREILATEVTIDKQVIGALIVSALVAIVAICRSGGEPAAGSIKPALFMLVLYAASWGVYVLVAAKAGAANFPFRYLQVSGLFLLATACLLAAALPIMPRKLFLAALVLLSTAGGAITFGVKVPTLEAAHARLTEEVLAEKARGGEKVVFLVPSASGGLMNPYRFNPAQTPFSEWWITIGYCRIVWDLSCAPAVSEQPRDIVVESVDKHDGLLARISVRAGK